MKPNSRLKTSNAPAIRRIYLFGSKLRWFMLSTKITEAIIVTTAMIEDMVFMTFLLFFINSPQKYSNQIHLDYRLLYFSTIHYLLANQIHLPVIKPGFFL